MANQAASELIRRLDLALDIDRKRTAGDHFRLPDFLREAVQSAHAGLKAKELSTSPAEGDRAEASGTRRAALQALETDLRGGYTFIEAIDHTEITAAERLGVWESYGWASGEIGRFDDERRIRLGKLAEEVAEKNLVPPAWRYTDARLGRIKASLAVIAAESDAATGGIRQGVTHERDTELENAGTALSRVRFYYCSASADTDATPELARLEFQPRRPYGTVSGESADAPTPAPLPPAAPTTTA